MNGDGGPEARGVGPPPPKESFMTKQIEVASIGASLWAWIAFVVSGVSLLFHIIAFAIPEWAKSSSPATKRGLWVECGDVYGCFIRKVSHLSDAERCTQTFAFFALVLMFVAAFLMVFYIYTGDRESKAFYSLVLVGVHGATAFCLMLAFAVWAGQVINKSNGLFTPGGAFGLEIVCFISEIGAAVLMFLDWNFSAR